MARAKKQAPAPKRATRATKATKANKELPEDEDLGDDLPEGDVEDVVEELVDTSASGTDTEDGDDEEETAVVHEADAVEPDAFVEVAGEEEAPDLDEVLSKQDNVRNLAIRREIERRLEERRLAKDLDDLILDD